MLAAFLCAFAQIRNAIVSLIMTVRPSSWNNSAPTGRIFIKFDVWLLFFRKYVEKIQVSLKNDKNNGYFKRRSVYIFIISRSILVRNVSDRFVKKIETVISC